MNKIQHGDAKFTTQTLSRMGLIDAAQLSPEKGTLAERLKLTTLYKNSHV